jgi:exosome complex exonuclease DIS3/RRP44
MCAYPTLPGRRLTRAQHLPAAALAAGIKSGALHQGHFSASAWNYLEGTVRVPALAQPVLLVGRASMNRAVHGDVVAVELLPEAEWRAPAEEVVDQDGA